MPNTDRAPRKTKTALRTRTLLVESWGYEVCVYEGRDGDRRYTLYGRGRKVSETLRAGEFLAYLSGFVTATERRINPVLLRRVCAA